MGELRDKWKASKDAALTAFKKDHALEVLDVDMAGVTGFPFKFELGLGPVLDSYESAKKKNKTADVQKYLAKSKEIVGKYKTRVTNKKGELGGAYEPLNKGILYLEAHLK
jgi:hypothetical protein